MRKIYHNTLTRMRTLYVVAGLFGLVLFVPSSLFAQKSISKSDDVEVLAGKSVKRKKGQTIDHFTQVTDSTFEVVLKSKSDFNTILIMRN